LRREPNPNYYLDTPDIEASKDSEGNAFHLWQADASAS
jgi:hypothetical protein